MRRHLAGVGGLKAVVMEERPAGLSVLGNVEQARSPQDASSTCVRMLRETSEAHSTPKALLQELHCPLICPWLELS